MMPSLITTLFIASLFWLPIQAGAQTAHEGVTRSLGLPEAPGSATEIRVWLGGSLRVSTILRVVKSNERVSVERFAWTNVVRPVLNQTTASDARRETGVNRQWLQKERCVGDIVETDDHLWCRLPAGDNNRWPWLFDDLLPDELWKLPPQGDRSCRVGASGQSLIVLDGEAVGIEIVEGSRRHSVEYWNPETCCPTVACAIANHVRFVVRDSQ